MESDKNISQKYQNINELFYNLVDSLEECRFNFCAYVVEEAYHFYRAELKKRLSEKIN